MRNLTNRLENLKPEELEKLRHEWDEGFFDVAADILLLSYVKRDMQKVLREASADRDAFIRAANAVLPLGFGEDCYRGWLDIRKRGWTWCGYAEDKASGFETVAYRKGRSLVVGIAGSDTSVEDWVDNDARLVIPKGPLIPTQYRVVRKKVLALVEGFRKETGRLPKELLLAGNSLGGAVAVVAYAELFLYAMENAMSLRVLTYNSAPVRLEYLRTVLERNKIRAGAGLTDYGIRKFYRRILHLINEDDILNNILYKLIRGIENFGHIGTYLIVENKGEDKERDLLHYAKEHLNVLAIRDPSPASVQDIGFHARNMKADTRVKLKKTLSRRVIRGIQAYNGRIHLLDRVRGALLGLALGDSAGHRFKGVGDATTLALALAKGLLEASANPEPAIAGRFLEWYALDRREIGRTTETAMENAIRKQDFPTGAKIAHEVLGGRTAGNASLKRVLPVALAYGSLDDAVAVAGIQSNMTHFDPRAKEACQLYVWLVYLLLEGRDKEDALDEVFGSHLHYMHYRDLEAFSGSAFVPDSLLEALAVFHRSESFEDGLERIGRLQGGDQFGALAGGLLGAAYGKKAIGIGRSAKLKEKLELLTIAGRLFDQRMKGRER